MLVEFELEALHKIISYAFFLEKFWDLGLLGFVLLLSCINLTDYSLFNRKKGSWESKPLILLNVCWINAFWVIDVLCILKFSLNLLQDFNLGT